MKDIIRKAEMLLGLTQSGKITWEHSDDIPCLSTTCNKDDFIVCKVESEDGSIYVSLNQLDKNQNTIGDFNRWEKYNIASERSHQAA
jgi:hypothetical protein